ncbi:fungal-specific transcription factor domain-containing protein [Colletotrichum godetiae]|uniref:Fungal-specific transcription factor domain-containing protein n=1 Tax=Colletotrichum godetiae TaxID=1209918 RepID=A0AAJ0EMJ6_9PEZI|nr:fungal-specific transcription factor domain-containing protein [Colletotrichum godetiae]KAK1657541.1 fungal-specific transcription factor domain-containing protein [Colletotrichum godetiae]
MSAREDVGGTELEGPPIADSAAGRVWQACLACRRKKIKCDGKQPCHNCSSRDQACEFPGTKDNASASRYYVTSFEARCQQMDTLCQRLEVLTGRLSQSIGVLNQQSPASTSQNQPSECIKVAEILKSLPGFATLVSQATTLPARQDLAADTDLDMYAGSAELEDNTRAIDEEIGTSSSNSEDDDDDDSSTVVDTLRLAESSAEDLGQAGALVRDSYGLPRFVGGAANNLIVEAAKSLLPNLITNTPSSTGTSHETPNLPDLEIPSFVPGRLWPPLPYIPGPESLPRPPQYVSDLLVSLYFDKLHYTFPILIKPHFMNRYQKLLRSGTDSSSPKRGRFLMVFFAVCACASGLLPSNLESGLPGIEFYQRSLLILSASTGESSIEKVQCLGLLSMCSAGWNTLSQSWNLAGQAVRGAIDMGLHVSGHSMTIGNGSSPAGLSFKEFALQEHSRRVWWCVYTLDRITSICLGRPLAVQDEDCHCELPSDVKDEDIVSGIKIPRAIDEEATMSPMSGFLAFARLCRLAGRIQGFSSPLKLRKIASADADKTHRFLARVDAHDQALRKWLESLPGEIQFSANRKNKKHGDISMVHCVITFFLHAGSLINLYRYFLNYPRESAVRNEVDVSGAIDQCVNAAQGCVYVADMVRDLVPSSHHLAICVHYLTLSGIILLRVPLDRSNAALLEDAKKCAQSLKDLEPRWSGAKRSREIIEQLLVRRRSEIAGDSPANRDNESRLSPGDARKTNKRSFADVEAVSSSLVDIASGTWDPSTAGSGTIQHDGCMDPMLFASWAG